MDNFLTFISRDDKFKLNWRKMKSSKKIGKFIVIDGADGSGKKTQTDLLVKHLISCGYDVKVADFPRYGERSATMVEDYLNGKFGNAKSVSSRVSSIFFAIDRYAASFEIKNWLAEGKIVISNRYVSANMGHQTGKIKGKVERDKFLNWLDELEFGIFNIPRPDKNIFLYVDPAIGQKLVDKKGHRDYVGGTKRDIHEADINHLKDAVKAYLYVAKKYNWDTIKCFNKLGMRSIDDIATDIWQKVEAVLKP